MSILDVDPDPEDESSAEPEIESPIDGPPPDWMRAATSASDSPLTEENTPDWLKSIRAGQVTKILGDASDSEPDPHAESESDPAAPETSAGEDGGMSDLERLLAEEGIDLGGLADERPDEAAGMSVRDWMIATSDDEIIRSQVGAEPIAEEVRPAPAFPRPLEPEPEAEPAVSPEPPASEPIPPQPVEAEPGPAPISQPGAATVPSEPAASKEDDKMVIEEDLPDWLREVAGEPEVGPGPAPIPAAERPPSPEPEPAEPAAWPEPVAGEAAEDDKMVIEQDLPNWLREISEKESTTQAAGTSPVAEAAASEVDSTAEAEMPDWLREVSGETAAAAPPRSGEDAGQVVFEEELPDWMREVEDSVEPAEAVERTAVEPVLGDTGFDAGSDEDLIDWLRDVEESEVEEEEAILTQFEVEPEISGLAGPGAADSTTIDDDEDLPDWLREVQADEGTEPMPEPDSAESVVVNEDDLPDWLKEVQASEEEQVPASTARPVLPSEADYPSTAKAETPPEMVAEDELPDWLQEVQRESPAEEFDLGIGLEPPVTGEDTVAEADLPDWLQEVEAGADDVFEPSEPSPDEFFSDTVEVSVDMVVENDLPDWLQDIEAGAEPLPEEGEAELAPVAKLRAVLPPEAVAGAISEPEALADEIERVTELGGPEVAEVSPIEVEVVEPTPAVAMPKPEPSPVAEVAPSDLPDWLKKLREGAELEAEEPKIVEAKPGAKKRPAVPIVAAVSKPKRVAETKLPDDDGLPDDLIERLEFARTLRDAGDIDEAARVYDSLVSSGAHLDKVIEDMQQVIKSHPSNYLLFQIMGDAMMKNGRLQSALEAYRQALTRL